MNIRLKPVWIALALATSAAQAAPVHDWYVGAGGGWAFAHDIDDFSQDVGKDATAINAFVGYNYNGVVDQIRRWMAVPQPVDTTQFTGWRTGIPSPISLFITFTPARISPTWAL
ncbi:hypothetical protein [Aeromonas caviae]|uniref:hypothetical protein n=1 Tax=Aeromonas caviae TaxID=648 RepID=UPI002F3FC610